jgi:hypothetical protein
MLVYFLLPVSRYVLAYSSRNDFDLPLGEGYGTRIQCQHLMTTLKVM